MSWRRMAAGFVVVSAMAGCLGGDIVTPSEARTLKNRTEAYDALRDRSSDIPNSAWSAMPTRGSATFDGVAALRVGPSGNRTSLVGDAQILVDFADGGISGSLDRFYGVDNTRDTAEYRGRLRGNSDTILVDGVLLGDFQGTPIAAISAEDAPDDVAVINGTETEIRLDILAEIER